MHTFSTSVATVGLRTFLPDNGLAWEMIKQEKMPIRLVTLIFVATLFAGCATTAGLSPRPESQRLPSAPAAPSTRPVYNLSGYSAAFKDGYVDGCETAKKTRYAQKDGRRFSADSQYRLGWNDGFSLCRRK